MIILLIVSLFSVSVSASTKLTSQQLNWQTWSPLVFQQAKQNNRLVLLDLTAKWCQWCKKMDAISYHDKAVIETIQKYYIAVRADEDDVLELKKKYKDYGRPATIIFNAKGEEIIKRRGYLKPQWLMWMLQAVAENPQIEAHQ